MGSEYTSIWTNQCFIDPWAEAKELKKMHDQEINEAVARKLGWTEDIQKTQWYSPPINNRGYIIPEPPDFCHDIKAAWELVSVFYRFGLSYCVHPINEPFWECSWNDEKTETQSIMADTVPMAICLAFLKLP